jgi:hypothetical protein
MVIKGFEIRLMKPWKVARKKRMAIWEKFCKARDRRRKKFPLTK